MSLMPCAVLADDWLTWPSTYTHDPLSGQRLDQFAMGEQPQAPYRENFSRSGYRHFRSTLQAGQSADNMHVVEQWGQPVVPYEQWRFPFRPYAVPYDAWGPQAPYGITNGYLGVGGGSTFGRGGYGGGYGGGGYGGHGSGGVGYGGGGYGVPPASEGAAAGARQGWPTTNAPPAGPRPGGMGSRMPYLPPTRGFPLTPPYRQEPWYDGNYPEAPPLGGR